MGETQTLTCFASGAVAYFEPVEHIYRDADGEKYLSGSTYAGLFGYPFQADYQAERRAEILGVTKQTMLDYWKSKADIATSFGTALHNAMEHYGKYRELHLIDKNPLGIHPTLMPIVEAFYRNRHHEKALYEAFVADELALHCGTIDRVVLTGHKRCIIEDFKTNGDLGKSFGPANLKAPADFLPNTPYGKYVLQLNFYQKILEEAGWTVERRRIHWWNGIEWETLELEETELLPPPSIAPEFEEPYYE